MDEAPLIEILLTFIGALVGGLIWVVKAQTKREAILIQSLTDAVRSFQESIADQKEHNAAMLETLSKVQQKISELSWKLIDKHG